MFVALEYMVQYLAINQKYCWIVLQCDYFNKCYAYFLSKSNVSNVGMYYSNKYFQNYMNHMGKIKSITHSLTQDIDPFLVEISVMILEKTLKKTTFKPLWKILLFQFQGLRSPLKPYFVQDLRLSMFLNFNNYELMVVLFSTLRECCNPK